MVFPCRVRLPFLEDFEIGRILQLKFEIRNQCRPVEHCEQSNKFNSINA
jgi:hypothetical protein